MREFLQSGQRWGQVERPKLGGFIGGFRGEVYRSATAIGQLRELTEDDLKPGIQPDTLVIAMLSNPERPGDIQKLEAPPKRTGKFAAFMDESERSVTSAGYHRRRVPPRPCGQHRQRVPA